MALDLSGLALKSAGNGEVRANCPFCGDTGGHLWINRNKGLYHCFRCGASGRIDGEGAKHPPRFISASVEESEPDPIRLDAVYRVLLDVLELSEEHRQHLMEKRGFSPEQIREGMYRTLPADSRLQIAGRVAEKIDPAGVPGFFRYWGGPRWSLAGPPGLLIPVRDWEGRIRGIQIRRDEGTPRYIWMSSSRFPSGTGARAALHMAGPPAERVWVTEGPLKANIAHAKTGETFVAVPGVTVWKKPNLVEVLKEYGVKKVVVAFDADFKTNKGVEKALKDLTRALLREGFTVFQAEWPLEAGKGIDDLLLGGRKPLLKKEELRGMNHVSLTGYLSGRLTLKKQQTKDGRELVIGRVKIIEDPQDQKRSRAIPIVAFGEAAETLTGLSEGTPVAISGYLSVRDSEDAYGNTFSYMEVVAQSISVIRPWTPPVNGSNGRKMEDDVPF